MANRLWEVDHPYYMCEGCYYSRDHHNHYESWEDFLDEWNNMDPDMNLVWRFDWKNYNDEEEDGTEQLYIFYIMQRKAYPYSVSIDVTKEQEPEIRIWLEEKWKYFQQLWTPFVQETS